MISPSISAGDIEPEVIISRGKGAPEETERNRVPIKRIIERNSRFPIKDLIVIPFFIDTNSPLESKILLPLISY
jgi:hypothetical protein